MGKTPFDQTEKFIEDSILDYLAARDVFAWKIKTVGTFDPALKKFRTPSKRYKKGVADILGIYMGRPLAIEVKSAKGRLSPHQKAFLNEFHLRGGIAILARSTKDVGVVLDGLSSTSNHRPEVDGFELAKTLLE